MSEVLKQPVVGTPEFKFKSALFSYLPSILAVGGSLLVALARKRLDDNAALVGAWVLATVGVYTVVLPRGIALPWRAPRDGRKHGQLAPGESGVYKLLRDAGAVIAGVTVDAVIFAIVVAVVDDKT